MNLTYAITAEIPHLLYANIPTLIMNAKTTTVLNRAKLRKEKINLITLEIHVAFTAGL